MKPMTWGKWCLGLFVAGLLQVDAALLITDGDFSASSIGNIGDSIATANDVSGGDGWYATNWTLGDKGAGDVFGAKDTTANVRGVINVITDNKATTGTVQLSIDALFPGNTSNAAQEKFLIKVWGMNDSDTETSGIQWDGTIDLNGVSGNPDGLDLRDPTQTSGDAPSYSGSYVTELLSLNSKNNTFIDITNAWQTVEFSIDLGETGYDQIVVGFSIGYTDVAGDSGVDNLQVVPEPATLGLLFVSVAGLLGTRRLKKRLC